MRGWCQLGVPTSATNFFPDQSLHASAPVAFFHILQHECFAFAHNATHWNQVPPLVDNKKTKSLRLGQALFSQLSSLCCFPLTGEQTFLGGTGGSDRSGVMALHNVGPHGTNAQDQCLRTGHNTSEHFHNIWVCWKSAMHALEQCHMDICPAPISVGQMLILHVGLQSPKMFFKNSNLMKLDLKWHGTDLNFWLDQIGFAGPEICATVSTVNMQTNVASANTLALDFGPLGPVWKALDQPQGKEMCLWETAQKKHDQIDAQTFLLCALVSGCSRGEVIHCHSKEHQMLHWMAGHKSGECPEGAFLCPRAEPTFFKQVFRVNVRVSATHTGMFLIKWSQRSFCFWEPSMGLCTGPRNSWECNKTSELFGTVIDGSQILFRIWLQGPLLSMLCTMRKIGHFLLLTHVAQSLFQNRGKPRVDTIAFGFESGGEFRKWMHRSAGCPHMKWRHPTRRKHHVTFGAVANIVQLTIGGSISASGSSWWSNLP